jgi:predicted ATPase
MVDWRDGGKGRGKCFIFGALYRTLPSRDYNTFVLIHKHIVKHFETFLFYWHESWEFKMNAELVTIQYVKHIGRYPTAVGY